jgi:transcriptional regulator GlxA family with amidase domain
MVKEEVCLRLRRFAVEPLQRLDITVNARQPARRDSWTGSVEAIISYINARFSDRITLADIGNAVGLHQTTISRIFQGAIGMTILEYLTRYRLSRAMHLLVDTDMSVTEISYECGFNGPSRMYAVFRERLATTPREFRLSVGLGN